jgi:hypothetical protein
MNYKRVIMILGVSLAANNAWASESAAGGAGADKAELKAKLKNIIKAKTIARTSTCGNVPIVCHEVVAQDAKMPEAFMKGVSFKSVKKELYKAPKKMDTIIRDTKELNMLVKMASSDFNGK